MTEEDKRTKAWIGDAVLALFAREWILKQENISNKERAEVFIQITSNQFLASIGDEAERIQNSLPTGRGYVCLDTGRLPALFKNLFSQQIWME